jgi:predicted DNA-binding protein
MARNSQLNLRVRPTLKAKLEKLAKEDRRTLSAYVEKLLEDYVEDVSQVGVERQQKAKQRGAAE